MRTLKTLMIFNGVKVLTKSFKMRKIIFKKSLIVDMGSEAGPSNQLQAPQRFLRTSLVPDTEITHIELTLSCILNEMTSRQVNRCII